MPRQTARQRTSAKYGEAGRIQFAESEERPRTLYRCEECAGSVAVFRCDACELLFCQRCCELLHLPIQFGSPNPHQRFIRAITRFDRGSVEFAEESHFSLPNAPFYEEDMMRVTDIAHPAALRTDMNPPKATTAYSLPRFRLGGKVLFINPNSGIESFGEVISNTLTGSVAHSQPILRGEQTLILYEVRVSSSIANIRREVKRFLQAREEEELALAIGARKRHSDAVTDILHRQYLYLAMDITLRANVARKLRAEIDGISLNFVDKTDVVVLSESDLVSPKDRWEQLEEHRRSLIQQSINSIIAGLHQRIIKSVLSHWHERAQLLTLTRRQRSAVVIQSIVRMHFARRILRHLRDMALQINRQKWQHVHSRFKFVDASNPSAVTMDGKRFFETTAEANRFFIVLRKVLYKCVFFMRRRYLLLYQEVRLTYFT